MLRFGNLVITGEKDEFNDLPFSPTPPPEVVIDRKPLSSMIVETGRTIIRSSNPEIINTTATNDSKPNVVKASSNLKNSQYLQDIWGD